MLKGPAFFAEIKEHSKKLKQITDRLREVEEKMEDRTSGAETPLTESFFSEAPAQQWTLARTGASWILNALMTGNLPRRDLRIRACRRYNFDSMEVSDRTATPEEGILRQDLKITLTVSRPRKGAKAFIGMGPVVFHYESASFAQKLLFVVYDYETSCPIVYSECDTKAFSFEGGASGSITLSAGPMIFFEEKTTGG